MFMLVRIFAVFALTAAITVMVAIPAQSVTATTADTFDLGGVTYGMTRNSDGSEVWITNSTNSTLIGMHTGPNPSVFDTIPLQGFFPWGVAILPGDRLAAVTMGHSANVEIINLSSKNTTVQEGDFHGDLGVTAAVNPEGTLLAVSYLTSNLVRTFSLPDLVMQDSWSLPSYSGLATWSPDGDTLAVSAYNQTKVYLLEPGNTSISSTLVTQGGPWGLTFSPDGSRLLVSEPTSSLIEEFNLASRTLLRSSSPDSTAESMPGVASYSPDGSEIWLPSSSGKLLILDATSWNVLEIIELPGSPTDVLFANNCQAFVNSREEGLITVLNLTDCRQAAYENSSGANLARTGTDLETTVALGVALLGLGILAFTRRSRIKD